jgi:gas vesicle protein
VVEKSDEKSEVIRNDIEQTRSEMGDTLDALGHKANVPARTKSWIGRKRQTVTGACGSGMSRISGVADSAVARVSGATPNSHQVQTGAGHMKNTAEQNPLGLALAGAAVGFLAGIFAPSSRTENEKLGPMSDQLKSKAVEAGQEAVEHGKQLAQSAAQSAVETAKEEGQQHGQELSSSLRDKASGVTRTSA